MRKKLLLATRNQNKKKELQEMLSELNVQVINLEDIEEIPEIVEDGNSFTENAVKKAVVTASLTGYTCLADDSGLVVDALDGRPGIYSARFAGEDADDEKNNQKLLAMLQGVEEDKRTARFVCVIAISDTRGNIQTVEGRCEGRIANEPRGDRGFGYDPLFIPEGFNITFAELAGEEKNIISHRGRALKQAIPVIKSFMTGDSNE